MAALQANKLVSKDAVMFLTPLFNLNLAVANAGYKAEEVLGCEDCMKRISAYYKTKPQK